jgi:hypothetical protein
MPLDGRSTFGRLARWITLVVLGGLLAACSSTASVSPSAAALVSTVPAPSPAPSPVTAQSQPPSPAASKGPATSQFALTGTAGLTGPVTAQTITCGRPSLQGPEIFFLGQAGTTGPAIVLFIRAGYVEARVATGSGATLRERDFTGTGVTSFDAVTGTQLDTSLTESLPPSNPGTLGALTRISGTIDCGNQQQGSANIVVSGLTPQGQLTGALTSVQVTCTFVGSIEYAGVVGLGMAGTTPVLIFVTGSTGTSTVTVENGSSSSSYESNAPAFTTFVAGAATMTGDLPEQLAAGATPSPYTVHVMGDAWCGSTVEQ